MDPTRNQYCVFPEEDNTRRQIGNFIFRQEDGRFSWRYDSAKPVYHKKAYYGTNKSDLATWQLLSRYHTIRSVSGYTTLYYHTTFREFRRYGKKPALSEELAAALKKDYGEWKRLRRAHLKTELEAEAAKQGITLKEAKQNKKKTKNGKKVIDKTNAKIEVVQFLDKLQTAAESLSDAIEKGTVKPKQVVAFYDLCHDVSGPTWKKLKKIAGFTSRYNY